MKLVVVGGGHAGVEAAYAAARLGIDTVLITINVDQIGQMSCNPSIGGVGKGHMVRELDALGGLMGRLADAAGIHFRVLNASRGLAVRGPRAQADRVRYRQAARTALERAPGLQLLQGMVSRILFDRPSGPPVGVELLDGSRIPCHAVVLTAGTFLRGTILVGDRRISGGRAGEPPSNDLAEQLESMGLCKRRFKTGTSPRINQGTVDFSKLREQPGDTPIRPFSFHGPKPTLPQVSCHICHTTPETESIIRANLGRSSMYGGHIEGTGPRYCPSIEDKFVKFPDKGSHQIFVEPDSLETSELYLAGLSTSMPVDVQESMVRSLPGFSAAQIVRPGYAIEYDAFDSLQLDRSLQVRGLEGLWMAGQINGTTGYEEAAGQGFVAGVNAALWLKGQGPWVLGRDQAYLGVMVDDLVTRGTDEPYRMLTARAEHRLDLACDLADARLLGVARTLGVASPEVLHQTEAKVERRERHRAQCDAVWVTHSSEWGGIAEACGIQLNCGLTLAELMTRQQLSEAALDACLATVSGWSEPQEGWDHALERDLLVYEVRYAPLRAREKRLLEGERRWEHILIPHDFRIDNWPGFSNEVREKLRRHGPETIGQAARIPGVTPAAATLLHLFVEKHREQGGDGKTRYETP